MYVCMYGCMHVCVMYGCVYARMHVWVGACMYGWMHSCMCVYPIYVIYPIQIHTSTYKYVHWIPASMNPFHNLTTLKYSWVWGSHPMSPGQGPSASQAAHWPGCNIWPTEIPVPSCWTVPHPWDQRGSLAEVPNVIRHSAAADSPPSSSSSWSISSSLGGLANGLQLKAKWSTHFWSCAWNAVDVCW